EFDRPRGDAFGIERARAQAALAQRIVDHFHARIENPLAELVAQETRLARDRIAIRRAGEVADQGAGDPGGKHDRHPPSLDLPRIKATDGTLAGSAPDRFGGLEVARMQ